VSEQGIASATTHSLTAQVMVDQQSAPLLESTVERVEQVESIQICCWYCGGPDLGTFVVAIAVRTPFSSMGSTGAGPWPVSRYRTGVVDCRLVCR